MLSETPELQYAEILEQRASLTTQERQNLQRTLSGYQGECAFDQCVLHMFQHGELVLDDVNLSYQGSHCQIDKLLVSGDVLYVVDVKNYDGRYQYQDGCWFYDGQVLAHNIFEQITRAQDLVARCLSDQHVQMAVKSVLVFMSSEVQLDLTDPPGYIEIKSFSEACVWLTQLNILANSAQDVRWKQALSRYFVPAYRPKFDLSATPQHRIKHGICCLKCKNFAMKQGHYALTCQKCGTMEAKEHAYVRTICEHGVLYFKHDLRRRNICEFFGEGYSERYIKLVLQKNFEPKCTSRSRNYSYWNKGVKFQYWFKDKSSYFRDM